MRVHFAFVALFVASCTEPDLFDLPTNPVPERGVRGVGPFATPESDATCASGDGCFDCELVDADCPDGASCAPDGLCTSACFVPDDDCSRLLDGASCTFGEQCASFRCTAVDGTGTCVSPCVDGACASGFTCVDGDANFDGAVDALCVPSAC